MEAEGLDRESLLAGAVEAEGLVELLEQVLSKILRVGFPLKIILSLRIPKITSNARITYQITR